MNKRVRMLAVTAVTLLVSTTVIPGLYGRPASLEWGFPEYIDAFAPYVLDVKALMVGDVEYLFVLVPHYSDNNDMGDDRDILVTQRAGDGWAEPVRVPLTVQEPFDCAYDASTGEFLFFFREKSWTTLGESIVISLARGNLTRPWSFQTVVETAWRPGVTGPYDMSAVVADDGTIDLFYCYVTGMTENLNLLYRTRYDGTAWSEPERLGVGNSPSAIRWGNGTLQVYSNLWTDLLGRQYCVDEWTVRDGSWNRTSLTTGARSGHAEPFAFEDGEGNGYIVYNHQQCEGEGRTELLVQTRLPMGAWRQPVRVVSDMIGYADAQGAYHYGIEHPCATVRGDDINLYYFNHGDLYTVRGRFR